MKLRFAHVVFTSAALTLGGLSGCGGGSPEGDLPAPKPIDQAESDRVAKQVQEGMKGGYKGAPGAPVPPGAK